MQKFRRSKSPPKAVMPRSAPGRRSLQLPRILVRIYIAVALMVAVIALSTIAFFHSAASGATWLPN